jgi:hypothetical protein
VKSFLFFLRGVSLIVEHKVKGVNKANLREAMIVTSPFFFILHYVSRDDADIEKKKLFYTCLFSSPFKVKVSFTSPRIPTSSVPDAKALFFFLCFLRALCVLVLIGVSCRRCYQELATPLKKNERMARTRPFSSFPRAHESVGGGS